MGDTSQATHTWSLASAAAVYDLAQAGVSFDIASTLISPPPATRFISPPPAPTLKPQVAATTPSTAVAVPTIWSSGAAGGLLVVLKGAQPPSAEAAQLLGNMLAATGFTGPVAYVGSPLTGFKIIPGLADALTTHIQALAPVRLLVLGQDMVNQLATKPVGVEGWQTAPIPLAGLPANQIVVTYPLELLLQRPLYKRLAWLTLMAWQ